MTTKVTPYDYKGKMSTPYGKYLDFILGDYERNKVFLIKVAVAMRRTGKDKPFFKIIALPIHRSYEPWTQDLMRWLRRHGKLSFDLTRNIVYTLVKEALRDFSPDTKPQSLRRWRLKHLVSKYEFTPYDIAAYAGWTFKTGCSQSNINDKTLNAYLNVIWRQYYPKLLKPIQYLSE